MTFQITNAGVHVIGLARREDGSFFDKFVITTNLDFNPTDYGAFGPPETREGSPSLPTLAISSPVSNAQFAVGTNIQIVPQVGPTTRIITKVEFFNGLTKIGQSTNNPYVFTWVGAPEGTNSLTAMVTDDTLETVRSKPVPVIVGSSSGGGIIVSIATMPPGLILNWAGGSGPYTIQRKTTLSDSNWIDVATTTNTSFSITATGVSGFYRIRSSSGSSSSNNFVFRVEDFGAVTNQPNVESNILAAINMARARGGGRVTLETPGEYLLYNTGTNPVATAFRTSVYVANAVDIELYGGPNVKFKLANGQQRSGLALSNGPVDLFFFYHCTNVTVSGAFTLDGNTEGQTGWTNILPRDRYTQVTSGNLIRSLHCEGVNVIGSGGFITLTNHFSNPINFDFNNYSSVRNIRVFNVGEGIQYIDSVGITLDNLWTFNSSNTMVGDCYETATCTNITATRLYAYHGGGSNLPASFFDGGGSENLVLDGFDATWPAGVGFGIDALNSYPRISNYKVLNGTLRGNTNTGYYGFECTEGNGVIHNVTFRNFHVAIYSDTTQRITTAVSDCTFEGNIHGAAIYGLATLDISRSTFRANTNGLLVTGVYGLSGGTNGPTIHLRDNQFLTNSYGVFFTGNGADPYTIRGEYGGNYFLGNGTNVDNSQGYATIRWTNSVWTNGFVPDLNNFPSATNGTAQWRGNNFLTLGTDVTLFASIRDLPRIRIRHHEFGSHSLTRTIPESDCSPLATGSHTLRACHWTSHLMGSSKCSIHSQHGA